VRGFEGEYRSCVLASMITALGPDNRHATDHVGWVTPLAQRKSKARVKKYTTV
jgi:hypothetical protein